MSTSGTPYTIRNCGSSECVLLLKLKQIYLTTMYGSTIGYHSDLSDRSALEIRVKIRVRLRVALC